LAPSFCTCIETYIYAYHCAFQEGKICRALFE
jgi:hypothetical protein